MVQCHVPPRDRGSLEPGIWRSVGGISDDTDPERGRGVRFRFSVETCEPRKEEEGLSQWGAACDSESQPGRAETGGPRGRPTSKRALGKPPCPV